LAWTMPVQVNSRFCEQHEFACGLPSKNVTFW